MCTDKIEPLEARLKIPDPSTRFASEFNNESLTSETTPLHRKGRR
jgi:hypothetical protein